MPGGSRIVVQRNYQAVHLITTPALCSYAELEALRGKVGTRIRLTLGLMGGAAYLMAVAPVRVHDSSCYLVDLGFRYYGAINEGGVTTAGTELYGSTCTACKRGTGHVSACHQRPKIWTLYGPIRDSPMSPTS